MILWDINYPSAFSFERGIIWLAILRKFAYLSKIFLKNVLEIVLEAEILASSTASGFEKGKTPKALDFTGDFSVFYCPIFSFILRYCRIFSKVLKTVCRQARGFESHSLRQEKPQLNFQLRFQSVEKVTFKGGFFA